jgi:type I restriction enzyme S subunit
MRQILIPYSKYQDTNDLWIKKVPSHWTLTRQKNIVKMLVSNVDKHTNEGEMPVRLCNYVDVYKNDRITESLKFMKASAKPDEIKQFRLRFDDLLITKDSESWNDIGVPALVEYTADDLVCGYHLAILRSNKEKISGGYLNRLHQCEPVKIQYHVNANGVTRYGLSHDSIENIVLPLPPLDEQNTIVRFLDYTDRRIKRYIRTKQKLIKLLEEEKQAIIHQAITRGVNPNVSLKPSGVEWLGDIPSHWKIRKLKTMCRMKSGESITGLSIDEEGAYPVYGGNGLRGFTSKFSHNGSFLLVGRQGALCGNVHLVNGFFWASEHAVVVTVDQGYNINWMNYLLMVMNLNQYSIAAAQPGLSVERILNLSVPLPPINEQDHISSYVIEITKNISKLSERIHKEISLLHEYRTRLIADVVTGKLDVRAAAAQLPEELEEEIEIEEVEPEEEEELQEELEP